MQADERTALIGWLDLQRQILRWKCDGLSEADAHRSVVPTSPAMATAGLISHTQWVEHTWLEVAFLGADKTQNPSFDETDEDADWRANGAPLKWAEETRRHAGHTDIVRGLLDEVKGYY